MNFIGILLVGLAIFGVIYLGYGLYKDIKEKIKNKKGGKGD